MIAIDLSKQRGVDANQKIIQQINYIGNLDLVGNATMVFILEEVKQTILHFLQATVRVL